MKKFLDLADYLSEYNFSDTYRIVQPTDEGISLIVMSSSWEGSDDNPVLMTYIHEYVIATEGPNAGELVSETNVTIDETEAVETEDDGNESLGVVKSIVETAYDHGKIIQKDTYQNRDGNLELTDEQKIDGNLITVVSAFEKTPVSYLIREFTLDGQPMTVHEKVESIKNTDDNKMQVTTQITTKDGSIQRSTYTVEKDENGYSTNVTKQYTEYYTGSDKEQLTAMAFFHEKGIDVSVVDDKTVAHYDEENRLTSVDEYELKIGTDDDGNPRYDMEVVRTLDPDDEEDRVVLDERGYLDGDYLADISLDIPELDNSYQEGHQEVVKVEDGVSVDGESSNNDDVTEQTDDDWDKVD